MDAFRYLFEDLSNNIWMNNENVILKLNPESTQMQAFTSTDKLWDNVFYSSCPVVKLNEIQYLLGGNKGYNILDVNQLMFNTMEPQLVINDMKILNQSVFSGQYESRIDHSTDRIVLKNKENNFSFEFSALCYDNPEKQHYAYRLTGYDNDWHIHNQAI